MTLLDILFLAVVQGIAEFLPISSSGHLVVIEELLLPESAGADLNIVLHSGTLLSILVFYWRRVSRLIFDDRRVLLLLIAGTLPAVVLGLLIKTTYEPLLESALLAGPMLLLTGWLLLRTKSLEQGALVYQRLSYRHALLIGIFQALALLPGVSRSGSTIFAGLLVGLDRRSAATFSFLLAIPAIAGANLLELREMLAGEAAPSSVGLMAAGAGVAFVVGLGSLAWLIRWIERGKLHYFAYWCIPVGIGVLIWQLTVLWA